MDKNQIFITFCIAQYIIDRYSLTCQTNIGEVLLIIHHFVSVYLYLGTLFFNPLHHLIVCLIVFIHWYSYGRCILTVYTNKYCGVDIERPFNDFIKILGIHKIHKNIHWFLLSISIIIDLYLIHI